MANVCDFTGKRPKAGNNVSFSNRKTKRVFAPNTFWKWLTDPETGESFRVRLSAKAIRTLTTKPRKLLEFSRAYRKKYRRREGRILKKEMKRFM